MIKRYQRTALPQYFYVILILLIAVGVGFLSKITMERIRFVDYFAIPWAAGRSWLLEGRNPYDSSVISYVDRWISQSGYLAVVPAGETFQLPLINLLFYLPFSLVPYAWARIIWMVFLLVAFIVICYYSLRLTSWDLSNLETLGMILVSLIWFPSLFSILTGQLTLIIVMFSILCIYLISAGKDMTAGFLMALMVGSLPQSIFLLICFIILAIVKKRWTILSAFFSGTAFLLVVTFLLMPSWFIDWLSNYIDVFGSIEWIQNPLMQLAAILPGVEQFLVVTLHVIFGLFLLFLWITIARKTDRTFVWNSASVLVLTFLLHVQINISLMASVLLAEMLVFRFWNERWGMIGKVLSWMMLLAISAISWVDFTEADFTQNTLSSFLTFGLPLLILLALLWIRWWAVKIPRVNDEF